MKANTAIVVAWIGLMWFGLGSIYRAWSLSLWQEDLAPATVHAALPIPGANDAAAFLQAYERMEHSNLLTHALTYYEANEAHKRWATHYR